MYLKLFNLECCKPEYSPGQYEINVEYDDPLVTADNHILLKYALKAIADRL